MKTPFEKAVHNLLNRPGSLAIVGGTANATNGFITARRKLRNDSGKDGSLGPLERFVCIDGLYYSVAQITSVPGISIEELNL